MIKSMTGFGKASAEASGRKITVEVKSLNSKQLDLSVKLPASFRGLDYELRALATGALGRGKAELTLSVEGPCGPACGIDAARFRAQVEAVRALCADWAVSDDAIVASVLRMPEVTSAQDAALPDEEHKAALSAAKGALEELDAFRRREGAALLSDILSRVGLIEGLVSEVEPFEKARIENIKTRLHTQLEALESKFDAGRLEQELIFYLERLDVTEEKVRLGEHCAYFREVAREGDAPGRKLGFVAQEMGREINTLGSKSNQADMQRAVVRMKDELEKIKEQLLNIL